MNIYFYDEEGGKKSIKPNTEPVIYKCDKFQLIDTFRIPC